MSYILSIIDAYIKSGKSDQTTDELLCEAGDEIERLNTECEQWVHRYDTAMVERQMWREAAEAAQAENARLREALKTNMALIRKAQVILCEQLMGPPCGLSDHTALNKLHRLLDGPEQREALDQARAALAEQERSDERPTYIVAATTQYRLQGRRGRRDRTTKRRERAPSRGCGCVAVRNGADAGVGKASCCVIGRRCEPRTRGCGRRWKTRAITD